MNWWKRHLRRSHTQAIEDHLMYGGSIPLQLAPDLVVHVDLNGLTMAVQTTWPMADQEGRRLLLAARYAPTCPEAPTDPPQDAEDPPEPGEGRTIRVSLSHQENDYVGDVLAAYFRLTEE